MPWRKYAPYVAVVGASVCGAAWTGQQAGEQGSHAAREEVSHQLIIGCRRSNMRVDDSNQRAVNHRRQDEAIALIASTAEQARRAQARVEGGTFNVTAARRYHRALELVRSIKFEPLPLTDCEKAYGVR